MRLVRRTWGRFVAWVRRLFGRRKTEIRQTAVNVGVSHHGRIY